MATVGPCRPPWVLQEQEADLEPLVWEGEQLAFEKLKLELTQAPALGPP